MSTFSLRCAEINDAALLAELGARCFSNTFGHLYSEKNLQAYLSESFGEPIQRTEIGDPYNSYFIAEADGLTVGFAKLAQCKMPIEKPIEPAMELHRLYIIEGWQSHGIGNALMNAVIEEARSMQAASLYLSVWENNFRAQAFYQRFGFRKIGEYHFYVGEHADNEWIMELLF